MTSPSPPIAAGGVFWRSASPPDFESPTDADRDNVYEVTVEATDSERRPRSS